MNSSTGQRPIMMSDYVKQHFSFIPDYPADYLPSIPFSDRAPIGTPLINALGNTQYIIQPNGRPLIVAVYRNKVVDDIPK